MNIELQPIMTPRKFALLASFLVAGLGVSVLMGWAFNVASLNSIFPGLATMKANNAAAMFLSGVALALLARERTSKRTRLLARMVAAVVVAVGAVTLLEYFTGWDLRMDQALFREAAGTAATQYSGRTSPSSALCFLFGGSSLFVASVRSAWRWRWPVMSAPSAALGILGTMTLVAYLMEALFRFHLWNYTGVAIHTAAGFALTGAGLLALVRSEGGLVWEIDASATRGILFGVASINGGNDLKQFHVSPAAG